MFGGGEGSPAGGRRKVAGLVEREGSPAGWKAKGCQKCRGLKDEASRIEHHWRVELHQRCFSSTMTTLKRRR